MFDAQQLAARLANREDRWSLLKDFVAEWHRPLQDGDGYSAEELDEAERRLGLTLPLALREWYQLAGRRKDITATQNQLASPTQLQIDGDLLVFHLENQNVVEWGIQVADLHLVDPPVWLDQSGLHTTRHECVRENDTLSEFALQMVVVETIITNEQFGGTGSLEPETLAIVEQDFVRLGFPGWHCTLYPMRFYGGDDVLCWTAEDEDFRFAARNREAFDKVKAVLEINWESLTEE